jgi:MoxR-like ATPase
VTGLAKTLLVSTVARVLQLAYKRVQITTDLMPTDVTGADILQDDPDTGKRRLVFLPGPLFANVLLADEVNRASPKTQAALLEAMQEGQVTAGGQTYRLPEPFFVLATQNPIEQEGTYPLPEAQLDRFLLHVRVEYPSRTEEISILKATTGVQKAELTPVLDGRQLARFQEVVRQVVVADHVFAYAADLVRATRPKEPSVPKFVPELVQWGAGPRASQGLIVAAKARAALAGRFHATTEDVRAVALPVLRHRLVTTFHADAEGITPDAIIGKLLDAFPPPTENGGPKRK